MDNFNDLIHRVFMNRNIYWLLTLFRSWVLYTAREKKFRSKHMATLSTVRSLNGCTLEARRVDKARSDVPPRLYQKRDRTRAGTHIYTWCCSRHWKLLCRPGQVCRGREYVQACCWRKEESTWGWAYIHGWNYLQHDTAKSLAKDMHVINNWYVCLLTQFLQMCKQAVNPMTWFIIILLLCLHLCKNQSQEQTIRLEGIVRFGKCWIALII